MSKFKDDFMRKASRAVIMVMLPVTLAVSMSSFAGPFVKESDAATNTPPVATQTVKAEQIMASAPVSATLEQIKLENTTDHTALLQKYPFLKDTVKEVNDSNQTGILLAKTQIWTGSLYDARTKTDILFVSLNGSDFCGNSGCATKVYNNADGKGYKESFSGLTNMVYAAKSAEGTTLVMCGAEAASQFVLKNGKFEAVATPTPASQATAQQTCFPPAPPTAPATAP